ncbi:MAG: arylsulfotransferase family protein [Pseudomonadota bacterium]
MMTRSVPAWLFALVVLALVIGAIFFGRMVMNAMHDPFRATAIEKHARSVAAFPDLAHDTLKQISAAVTGPSGLATVGQPIGPDIGRKGFEPLPMAEGIGVVPPVFRADRDRLSRGWRMLYLKPSVEGEAVNAALLLDPDLRIVKFWRLSDTADDGVGPSPHPERARLVHGVEITRDGALFYTFDGSPSMHRIDSCATRIWHARSPTGPYHHAITLSDDGESLWTFVANRVGEFSTETGEELRSIGPAKMWNASPDIDLLKLRMEHRNLTSTNDRNTTGRWLTREERFHFNDVDPLPSRLAPKFPMFEAGDLLISARELNLVYVIDPETFETKWWRVGQWNRQHDPEWMADGRIGVYDNRMSRDYSRIVAIDPVTYETEVLFDGREVDFYSRIRGKLQVLEDGTLVTNSPQQGRAFEVTPDGDVVLEIVNHNPGRENHALTISEMRWFPPGHFTFDTWACPPAR